MSCLCPSINASKCIEYGYGELKKAGAGEDTLSKAAAAQFRKHKDKFSWHRSEEDEDKNSDGEQADSILTTSKSAIGDWPVEAYKKRASEPLISYTPALNPEYVSKDHVRRNVSVAGSEVPVLSSQVGQLVPVNTSSVSNPLGLTLVYTSQDPILDLIFVHGLGGTSKGTWSWERDPTNFWPLWLGSDTELSRSRVFTFGYNAAFTGQYTSSGILDFAKDLLFRIKTYSGGYQEDVIPFGKLPILFVVHSMGGLVVKKAYIIGKSDPQYSDIIACVSSIVFLATPHKGSAFAQTLNNIVKTTPGGSAKAYIAELERNSGSLQDINEQFRNICAGLELVSLHETLKTSLGVGIKRMIVDKDSALLEYPGETSSSLVADHHGMSKFKSVTDTNYINVKNVLRWLMKKIINKETLEQGSIFGSSTRVMKTSELPPKPENEMSINKRLMSLLGVTNNINDDLDFLADRTMRGSCQWLLKRQSFQDWAADSPNASGLLWLTGNPGSGKSTMASFIIGLLKRRSFAGTCHYHFFLAGHQAKRTISYLLRSIALQAALSHDDFCLRLLDLHENTGINFSQQKATVIWEKIFEGILFRLPPQEPLFWVFDGLDEAESPTELTRLLSKIKSATRINVLLVSRATKDLIKGMNDHLPTVVHEAISVSDIKEDIQDYVRSSMQRILPDDHSQEDVIQEILAKASGSFLWVKLALNRIRDNGYTKDDIRAALTEIPEGMEPLYKRMLDLVASQPLKPRTMATRILTLAVCSFRPLEIAELEVALKPEFRDFVSLRNTVEEICGHFIIVNKSTVTLIHQTAHQFLLSKTFDLPIKIVGHEGHEYIATVCIDFLSEATKWRRIFSTIQIYQESRSSKGTQKELDEFPFLSYALSFWAYHVSLASLDSEDLLETVLSFLERNFLLWINGVGLSKNLRILTQAAQCFKKYIKRRASTLSKRLPTNLVMARDDELRQWANDLIRVVGRFGNNVAESPSSIYKYVVPFCPKDSIIFRTFGHVGHSTFSVTGLSSTDWDDCLARLTMGEDQTASKLLCKDTLFATLVGIDGTLIVWYSETCEEARRFTHGEYVTHMASSETSNFVATAGFKTTRIWDITTGKEFYRLPKERHHHTRALKFGAKDDDILIAYDDCSIQCVDLVTAKEKWRFLAKEPESQDYNCARYMAISPDLTQIAVVFRGRPVVVWTIQSSRSTYISPKRCILRGDKMRSATEGDAWNAPEVALWHPILDHLLILYEDTKIVDWNLADDEQVQYDHTGARAMVLSTDGNLLLTSDVNGTLSIWMVPGYRLTYQLKYDDLVMDLAFSPDGTRFYDIRGTFCNVWEPDALVRPNDLDHEDMSSTYETITSEPVLSNDDNTRVPITALICDSSDRFYCCGKEDGTVIIYSIPEGNKVRKLISHSSSVSIIKLAWSISERYFASADDSGRVIAKRLEPPSSGKSKWAVFPLFDMRMEEAVEHLLLSISDEFLLIAGPNSACVVSLKSKKELCRVRHSFRTQGLWTNHPSDPASLVRIDASEEHEYLWKTLAPRNESPSLSLETLNLATSSDIIHRVDQIQDRWLLLEILTTTNHKSSGFRNRKMELLDICRPQNSTLTEGLKRQRVLGLAEHIRLQIGCLQDRFVFIDHQFWICTWEIESVYSKHKRHFFLPKDWLSPMALRLIVLNKQGTLLCPKNGEVAIVRSGFKL